LNKFDETERSLNSVVTVWACGEKQTRKTKCSKLSVWRDDLCLSTHRLAYGRPTY